VPTDARNVRLHRALTETQQLLTEHIERTIAELHRALDYIASGRDPLDSRLAEIALDELVGGDVEVRVTAETVMAVTAGYYGITTVELSGRRGMNTVAHARQVAMYLCRELTELSLPQIGDEFDRDHTTVMHGVRKIRGLIACDERVARETRDLTVLITKQAGMDALQRARKVAA
jgi:chromosomal replication initiator protein